MPITGKKKVRVHEQFLNCNDRFSNKESRKEQPLLFFNKLSRSPNKFSELKACSQGQRVWNDTFTELKNPIKT